MTLPNRSEALPRAPGMNGAPRQPIGARNAAVIEPPRQQTLFDLPPAQPPTVADSQPSGGVRSTPLAHLPIYRVQLVHEASLAAPRTFVRAHKPVREITGWVASQAIRRRHPGQRQPEWRQPLRITRRRAPTGDWLLKLKRGPKPTLADLDTGGRRPGQRREQSSAPARRCLSGSSGR